MLLLVNVCVIVALGLIVILIVRSGRKRALERDAGDGTLDNGHAEPSHRGT